MRNKEDNKHLPASMEEWNKLESALTTKQPDNLFYFDDPEKPKRHELEKAIRKARFYSVMANKYKNWFASYDDFVFAKHSFNDLYWEFMRKHEQLRPARYPRARNNNYE